MQLNWNEWQKLFKKKKEHKTYKFLYINFVDTLIVSRKVFVTDCVQSEQPRAPFESQTDFII